MNAHSRPFAFDLLDEYDVSYEVQNQKAVVVKISVLEYKISGK